ncbi:MAG: SusD/RagB family nutrient-binding outer membrane lipoprotein [Saprospiraceae bacterium]|nr:SusD/RagB family nutrient-binding outer membrane lipoprotein [Saprospiraceae bacterium]
MKNILYLTLISLFLSCNDGFEEINTNPNAPVNVQPEFLLRQVLYNYGEQMSYEGFVAGNLLGQYFTAVDFNLFDRHSLLEPQFGGSPWPIFYKNLRDNQILLDKARTEPAAKVYEGPALIIKAHIAAALTDIFGDVPYSEAFSGRSGVITPKYDAQEDIYTGEGGIIDNLNKAIMAIDAYKGSIPLSGDIIFNGDLSKWKRWANSLKIKALMRIHSKENVASELQSIYNQGLYISSANQNAVFSFTTGAPNNFRMATARVGDFNIYIMSETMQEILEKYQDPRAQTFFRPASNTGQFKGLLNGPDASKTSITVGNYSLAGTVFRENTGALQANLMTSWETLFFLAEAAQRGYISADAKSLYESAVNQAFAYWKTPLPAEYLSTGKATWGIDGTDPIEQICTQKWLANIINGYEGWIDYKRTGYPELKNVAASLNNNLIPVRMPYPPDEQALNAEQYGKAAGSTNNNSVNAKLWWMP